MKEKLLEGLFENIKINAMKINEISSAIYNDIMSGLVNITSDPNISLEQLEDEVVEERQAVIKEW